MQESRQISSFLAQFSGNLWREVVRGDLISASLDYTEKLICFDKYLNEVLYLFENVKTDAILFEDMDRFNASRIFERLREVNDLKIDVAE